MRVKVLILIAAVFGLAVLGEGGYIATKKIEKYRNKIILQENILEKAVDILSGQQSEVGENKRELRSAPKDTSPKNKGFGENHNGGKRKTHSRNKSLEEKIKQAGDKKRRHRIRHESQGRIGSKQNFRFGGKNFPNQNLQPILYHLPVAAAYR